MLSEEHKYIFSIQFSLSDEKYMMLNELKLLKNMQFEELFISLAEQEYLKIKAPLKIENIK